MKRQNIGERNVGRTSALRYPIPMPSSDLDPGHRESLLLFLKDRDVACPYCHYNLRSLEQVRGGWGWFNDEISSYGSCVLPGA